MCYWNCFWFFWFFFFCCFFFCLFCFVFFPPLFLFPAFPFIPWSCCHSKYSLWTISAVQVSYPQQKIHSNHTNTAFSVRGKKQNSSIWEGGKKKKKEENIHIFLLIVLFTLAFETYSCWYICLGSPQTTQLSLESSVQAAPGKWNPALKRTSADHCSSLTGLCLWELMLFQVSSWWWAI